MAPACRTATLATAVTRWACMHPQTKSSQGVDRIYILQRYGGDGGAKNGLTGGVYGGGGYVLVTAAAVTVASPLYCPRCGTYRMVVDLVGVPNRRQFGNGGVDGMI